MSLLTINFKGFHILEIFREGEVSPKNSTRVHNAEKITFNKNFGNYRELGHSIIFMKARHAEQKFFPEALFNYCQTYEFRVTFCQNEKYKK